MDSATINKLATTAVIAGAAFAASKMFEFGWKTVTKRPIPAEDSDDVTLASLVLFAASTAAVAAVAQRYPTRAPRSTWSPRSSHASALRRSRPKTRRHSAPPRTPSPATHTSGRKGPRSVRSPDALTREAATASSHVSRPHASDSHVRASVSTTAGGVPRRCVVPGRICTAPAGGTRTSTERPGCREPNSSRVKRTAVSTTARGASSPRSHEPRQARSASIPEAGSMRRFTIRRFYVRHASHVGVHSNRLVRHN